MRLHEAEAWLEGLIDHERRPTFRDARFSLDPVRRLLKRVGDPQRGLSVLHVAGSKGKGSVALWAEALLRETGRHVGTFTQPHLERWTERFRLDGAEVDGDRLARVIERLRPHADELRAGSDPPTWFDVTTAAALLLFADAGVDHAVLEVGLGGRLDSTNVVDPAVCAITSIELEHTERLGKTLAEIAREKAGILKAGVPAVTGELPEEAAREVARRASVVGAPLFRAGHDFSGEILEEGWEGCRVRLRDGPLEVVASIAAPGRHQATNAALALAMVRRLHVVPDARLAERARVALSRARLPARIEIVSRRPWIVIDCAHTGASARELARVLARLPRRRSHLVLSISAGKDVDAICRVLAPLADAVTVTRAQPARSLSPREVADALQAWAPGAEVRVVPNPHLALRAARESLGPADLLCATGSVYLAGIARRVLTATPDDGD